MKLHQKGFLLVALSKVDSLWDQSLIAQTFEEYGSVLDRIIDENEEAVEVHAAGFPEGKSEHAEEADVEDEDQGDQPDGEGKKKLKPEDEVSPDDIPF